MNIPCTDSRAAKCHQHPTRSVDWTTAGVVWVLISIFQSCLHQRVGTSIIQQGGPLLFPVAYLLTYLSLSATSLDLFSCLRICFSALLSITCVCFLSSVVFGDCASPFLSRANLSPRLSLSANRFVRPTHEKIIHSRKWVNLGLLPLTFRLLCSYCLRNSARCRRRGELMLMATTPLTGKSWCSG